MFKSRQNIFAHGLQADTLQRALYFFKLLSNSQSLDLLVHEGQWAKKVYNLSLVFRKQFYEYLVQQ